MCGRVEFEVEKVSVWRVDQDSSSLVNGAKDKPSALETARERGAKKKCSRLSRKNGCGRLCECVCVCINGQGYPGFPRGTHVHGNHQLALTCISPHLGYWYLRHRPSDEITLTGSASTFTLKSAVLVPDVSVDTFLFFYRLDASVTRFDRFCHLIQVSRSGS